MPGQILRMHRAWGHGARDVQFKIVLIRAYRRPKPKKHVRGSRSAGLSLVFKKRSG